MEIASAIFFSALVLLVFTYGGYALVFLPFLRRQPVAAAEWPEVTVVIPAYNEERFITAKLENCLELDYPTDRVQFLVIADGSTDRTADIVRQHGAFRYMYDPVRAGKSAALNRALTAVTTPIAVITDANTLLDSKALKLLIRHFSHPGVGGVSGEKQIISSAKEAAAGAGEGLYWKYESALKNLDARFYSIAGAPGELFAFRTGLYEPIPADIVLDDFYVSMQICLKGSRVYYEPKAIAREHASLNVKEELKRKIRICAGGFQCIRLLSGRILRSGNLRLIYIYFAHRVFRWAVAPWCLVALILCNLLLFQVNAFFFFTGILQAFFYLAVGLGWLFEGKKLPVKGFFVPYYFFIMNYAAFAGLFRYLRGRQAAAWDRSERALT